MEEWVKVLIWFAVLGVVVVVLWRKGLLEKFRVYLGKTREELKKCSWPTREELKVSTAVVFVSVFLLGAFSLVVDAIITNVVTLLM